MPQRSVKFSTENKSISITYPYTHIGNQVDDYHGTKVKDPYRWLENYHGPEVKAWSKSQNAITQAYLRKIPFRNAIKERYTSLMNYARLSEPSCAGDYYFFCKNDGLQKQSVIYVQKGEKGTPQVFIDPNDISKEGTVRIKLLGISRDNRYVSISRAASGSDWAEIFVMEIATKKKLPEVLKWIKFPNTAWQDDGFYYSRYPQPKTGAGSSTIDSYHAIYYHKLGTSQAEDVLIYEDRTASELQHYASITEDEQYLIRYTTPGVIGHATYYKPLSEQRNFICLAQSYEYSSVILLHIEGHFLVYTNEDAPNGSVVAVDVHCPQKKNWKTIIPESENPLHEVCTGGGKLFVQYIERGTIRCFQYNYDGSNKKEIQLPTLGSVEGFWGRERDKKLFYVFQSFLHPKTIFKYDIRTGNSEVFYKERPPFSLQDYQEKQVSYKSKDGTNITMFIVHKKGIKLDKKNLCLLYGYGGFKTSFTPWFSPSNILLMEKGGVFALPQLRGGGEYGEAWHEAGMLKKKQNVFDDFIAAAEHLIHMGLTSPAKLAIAGVSNGGLLVGACVNQRPELFAVALPDMGIMDMLRYHHFTAGKLWVSEYGSSDNPAYFKLLQAYSPLHNLKGGYTHPATMAMTSENDDRVVPAHAFKYMAQLQKVYQGSKPMLLYVDTKLGHGIGMPMHKQINKIANQWAFVFYNTNTKW